jgi:hypothetical protein
MEVLRLEGPAMYEGMFSKIRVGTFARECTFRVAIESLITWRQTASPRSS